MRTDDLRAWLERQGESYEPLCRRLAGLDPYFSNLAELRAELERVFAECLPGGRAP
jgi:hypothetical protein